MMPTIDSESSIVFYGQCHYKCLYWKTNSSQVGRQKVAALRKIKKSDVALSLFRLLNQASAKSEGNNKQAFLLLLLAT